MLAFMIFLLSSSMLIAQNLSQPTYEDVASACSGDTLDVFPILFPGYCNKAVVCSRYEVLPSLIPLFQFITESGDTTYVEYEPPQRSWNENIRVLAWSQEHTALNTRHQQLSDSMGYTLWNLLLWNKSIDTAGRPQWSLMLLNCSINYTEGNIDTTLWSPVTFKGDNELQRHCCMVYSAPPNNEQIYQFIEGTFFGEHLEQKTAVRGIPGQMMFLMGGAVREKTWEACVGEAPTKFFFFEK